MKDIKIKFKGLWTPSGKRAGVEYMVGKARLEQWKKSGKFDIEVLDEPKPKPKKQKVKKEKK
tara:strand:+ start:6143 stop:6328 length:186 start_codon:yes stop_codon:yes gene_type:complete